jgi:acyl-CoA reductase-like NAD-dependent aldehyde dehydrogenase
VSPNPEPLASAFARQQERRLEPPAYAERQAALARLESLLRRNVEAFCAALEADFGARSANETRLLEVFPSLEALTHARRHLRAWMKPQRRATSLWFLPGRSRVMLQPLGVVGIVVPWNYPLYLAIGPLVAALAAGNRVLVKMSEAAPATGELLARLVAAEFDPASFRS